MNCKNCGMILTDEDKFCRNCGTPAQNDVISSDGMNMNSSDSNQQPNVELNHSNVMQQGGMGYNQYQNYGQPVGMGQNYNGMNYAQPSKQSSGGKMVAIIAVVVLLLGGLLAGGVVFLNSVSKTKVTKTDNGKTKTDDTDKDNVVDGDNVEKTGQQTTYKVTFNDFVFDIPSDYVYEDSITSLDFADAENTWAGQIEVSSGNYMQVKTQKAEVQLALQQQGYTVSELVEKVVGGLEYLVTEVSYSGQNVVVAITAADANHFITVTLLSDSNEYDHTLLEKVTPIIASATPVTENAGLNADTGKKLDLSKVEEIAKKKKDTKKKK